MHSESFPPLSTSSVATNTDPAVDLNRKSYNQILFRPRVMIDVENVDMTTKMLGQDVSLPVCHALSDLKLEWFGLG